MIVERGKPSNFSPPPRTKKVKQCPTFHLTAPVVLLPPMPVEEEVRRGPESFGPPTTYNTHNDEPGVTGLGGGCALGYTVLCVYATQPLGLGKKALIGPEHWVNTYPHPHKENSGHHDKPCSPPFPRSTVSGP